MKAKIFLSFQYTQILGTTKRHPTENVWS